MSRTNLEGLRGADVRFEKKFRLARMTQVLSAGIVLTKEHPPMLFLDANGAGRNVDLPAVTADMDGIVFFIRNTAGGAFSLTVRDAALATVTTIVQNTGAMVVCNGTVGNNGWTSIAIA